MAREVIVKTWCDPCLEQGEEREGVELSPTKLAELPGRARIIALCEVHHKELYEPFVTVLRELGQTVDEDGQPAGARGPKRKAAPAEQKPDKPHACPKCGKGSKTFPGLQAHVRAQHGTTLRELQGLPPFRTTGPPVPTEPLVCPECGQSCANAQGLGAHRKQKHGIQGTSH